MDKKKQQKMTERLKAVIVADTYRTTFYPITLEGPRVFLPVAGIPIIEYTLQWLQMNYIQEIIIVYTVHKEKIEEYFKESKVNLVYCLDGQSIGDALRAVYQSKLIEEDFLLFYGDMITNINLERPIQEHLTIHKKQEGIVTCIMRQLKPDDQLISMHEDYCYIIDHKNHQMLQIEDMKDMKYLYFNKDRMNFKRGQLKDVKVHIDLQETEIYICTLEVLKFFDQHPDKKTIKEDFIRELLTSEINEEVISVSIADPQEFSARMNDQRIYYHLNQQIIRRYSSPFTVQYMHNVLQKSNVNYNCQDFNKYMTQQTNVHYSSRVTSNCLIGHKTEVGPNCFIQNSTIGHNCKIGNDVKIIDSIIFNDVQIQNGVQIQSAIICDKVFIGENSKVKNGCILSYRTRVKPNKVLEELTKVTTFEYDDELIEVNQEKSNNFFEQGTYLYVNASKQVEQRHLGDHIGFQNKQFIDERFVDNESLKDHSDDEQDLDQDNQANNQEQNFDEQIKEIMNRIEQSSAQIEYHIDDMIQVKQDYQKSWLDCIRKFMPYLLEPLNKFNTLPINQWKEKFKQYFLEVKMLLKKAKEGGDAEEQEIISQIQTFCWNSATFKNVFYVILFVLNDQDVDLLSTEAILDWQKQLQTEDTEQSKFFIQNTKQFIDYLQQEEEEEEEDDGEEDDQ